MKWLLKRMKTHVLRLGGDAVDEVIDLVFWVRETWFRSASLRHGQGVFEKPLHTRQNRGQKGEALSSTGLREVAIKTKKEEQGASKPKTMRQKASFSSYAARISNL